jgi:NAD-dependent deacetylase
VFFGEAVPKMEAAIDLVAKADIVLIVGTSLSVYPAAGLYRFSNPDAPVWIIDPGDVSVRDPRLKHIRAVATEGMKEFIEKCV